MDAAKSAGAYGGTVFSQRNRNGKAEKFMGVSLAAEKEMIFIVPVRRKNAIMKAIMEQAGMETHAKAVSFPFL